MTTRKLDMACLRLRSEPEDRVDLQQPCTCWAPRALGVWEMGGNSVFRRAGGTGHFLVLGFNSDLLGILSEIKNDFRKE